jgi:hypothetical protein
LEKIGIGMQSERPRQYGSGLRKMVKRDEVDKT